VLRQGLPIATCWRPAARTQRPVLRRCQQPSARANPAAPFPVKEPEYTPKQTALRAASAVMVGVTGGAVGALIGAGGGIAVTPLLTALLSLQQHAAHGTALAAVTVTACAGAARYAAAGQVAPSAAAMIAASAMVFSPVGARFAGRLDAPRLKAWFGWFLVVVSVAIPVLPSVLASAPGLMIGVWGQRVVLVCVGVVTGFLSGLLGIGGGTVAVPAMVLLTGLSQKTAQGTALLAMILPSLLGAITHWRLGNVRLALLPSLALGAVLGGSLGGSVAVFLPETYLRVICSVIFGLIGVRYIRQSRNKLAPDSAETKSHGRAVSTGDQPIRKGDTDLS
jgi:uncharacterized protein